MARFTKDNQPAGRGRPKGSRDKRSQFSDAMTSTALEQLEIALNNGEQWAVDTVLKRTHAPLKAVTPDNSLDGEFIKLKMKEISEFEQRIAALEQHNEVK